MRGSTVGRRAETGLVRIATWIGGGCAAAAAAGGFFVGYVYTLDQGSPAYGILFGAIGLIVGAMLGVINAVVPVVALAAIDGWGWTGATPLRALVAALAAAAPSGAIDLLLTEEPSLAFTGLCAALTALPAAVATCGMDLRTARPLRSGRRRAAAR